MHRGILCESANCLATSYFLRKVRHEVARVHTHVDALLQLELRFPTASPAIQVHFNLLQQNLSMSSPDLKVKGIHACLQPWGQLRHKQLIVR